MTMKVKLQKFAMMEVRYQLVFPGDHLDAVLPDYFSQALKIPIIHAGDPAVTHQEVDPPGRPHYSEITP